MTEKEEQYRKINNEYTKFSYMFYEVMRPNSSGKYRKPDVNKQVEKLVRSLLVFKNMK